MSFYEGRRRNAGYGDVHEPPASAVRPAAAPAGADVPSDWTSVRKSRPVEHLLPIAARWIETLPPPQRPSALAAQYPRIANLIALQWTDAGACPAYFEELLMDRRGHRRGFPDAVHDELVRLRDHWYVARASAP